MQKEKVLVAGASGYLGRYAVHEFKKRGYFVRALVRNPEKLEKEGLNLGFRGRCLLTIKIPHKTQNNNPILQKSKTANTAAGILNHCLLLGLQIPFNL